MTATRPQTPPTPRALEILRWIDGYCTERGFSPTVRDIGRAFKIASPNAVQEHLRRLVARELLELEPGLARTARVTEAGRQALTEATP